MGEITKAKINLKEGTIELEGNEAFVRSYLDEFKGLLKEPAPSTSAAQESPPPKKSATKKTTTKKAASNKTSGSKKAAPKVSVERFDIHGKGDTPSLQKFIDEKKPGTGNGNIIAVIGYYITETLGNEEFSEGHIEYAYKMLKIKRPAHLHQIILNEKNKRDLFEANPEDITLWHLTRTGEIYVSDMLPES